MKKSYAWAVGGFRQLLVRWGLLRPSAARVPAGQRAAIRDLPSWAARRFWRWSRNLTDTYGWELHDLLSGAPTPTARRPYQPTIDCVLEARELLSATTSSLNVMPSPGTVGQMVTLNDTVSVVPPGMGTPTGNVSYYDGNTYLGTSMLNGMTGNDQAMLSLSTLSVGTHAISAIYNGDINFTGSTSNNFSEVINAIATNTTVTTTSAMTGQPASLTATITPQSPGTFSPSGSVTFYANGTQNLGTATVFNSGGSNGTASLMVSNLLPGTYPITAVYSGSPMFAGSTSTAGSLVITKANATVSSMATPSTSVYGQTVQLAAMVSGTAANGVRPTGTVTFFSDGNTLGTSALDSTGNANLSVNTLSIGSHWITVIYNGDSNFMMNTGPSSNESVSNASTSTVLTTSANPSGYGQAVTMRATVTATLPGGGTPSGGVSFYVDGSMIGTGMLDGSGVATFSVSTLSLGYHNLSATYMGGPNYNTSTSGSLTQQVLPATTTLLSAAPSPSTFGQVISLTATVTVQAPGTGTATGTVSFYDGSTLLGTASLNGDQATLNVSSLSAGTDSLQAVYGGSSSYAGSSGTTSQTVQKAGTATSLSLGAGTTVFGQAQTFTAAVTVNSPGAGTPTGLVTFYDGSTAVGIGTLGANGTATFLTSGLAVGTHSLTAQYNGDSNFATSTSGNQPATVQKADTSTALSVGPNPATLGQTVTLTATVADLSPGSGMPTGSVTFFDGSTPLGSVTLDGSGSAGYQTAALGTGTYTLTAQYNGDSNSNSSTSSALSETVNGYTTSTALTTSTQNTVYGQTVSFTATVTSQGPGTPTGTVTLFDNGTAVATVSVNANGTATWQTNTLSAGSHPNLTAQYGGDSSFLSSTSTADSVTVNPDATSTALTSDVQASTYGQSVTFRATVVAQGPGSGTPTGKVQFQVGSTVLGSATLTSTGTASFTTSMLAAGSDAVDAVYSGDSNFSGGSSAADTLTVSPAALTITANNESKTYGTTLNFAGTEFTSSGLQNGDTIGSVSLSSPGAVGTASVAGSPYTISISNAQGSTFNASNYTITYVNGSLTVNLASLTVTGITVNNKVYDGTTTATLSFTGATLSGVANGDTVALDSSNYTATFAQATVGTGISVTVSGLGLSGPAASNYTLVQPTGLVGNITPAALTVSGITVNNKRYDGTTTATLAFTGASLNGVANGDAVSLVATNSVANFSQATVGTGIGVSVSGLTLSGAAASNYTLTQPTGLTGNIGAQSVEGALVSLPITVSAPSGQTLTFTASGLPQGVAIDPTGVIRGAIGYGAAERNGGLYPVTVTATASGGTTQTVSFVWTVVSVPLTLTNPGAQTNNEGDSVSLPLVANGGENGVYTYSASGLPAGLAIDPQAGVISGTLNYHIAGGYQVTVSASDGFTTVSQTFTWTVTSVPLTLANPGAQSNIGQDNVSLQLAASGGESATYTYTASNLPVGLALDESTGLIAGTVGAAGAYSVTISASDGVTTTNQTFTWTVTNAPLTLNNPGNQSNHEGDTVSVQLAAHGGSNSPYVFSATGLPGGVTIDRLTGAITGTPSVGDALNGGNSTVTVTVSDGTTTVSQTFTWTVSSTPLTLANPGAQSNNEGDSVSLALVATGGASGLYVYTAGGLPAGVTLDRIAGTIAGTILDGDAGNYQATVSAFDGTSTVSQTFIWTIHSVPLTLVNPGAQSNFGQDSVYLQLVASGGESTIYRYSATGLPTGLSIDPQTGAISGTLSAAAGTINGGADTVTVTATDGSSTVSQTFGWTVTNVPLALVNPGNQSNNEGDQVLLPLTAQGGVNSPYNFTVMGLPGGVLFDSGSGGFFGTVSYGDGAAATGGVYHVTVSVSDGTSTVSQTFTWTIASVPLTLANPGAQSNNEAASVSLTLAASGGQSGTYTYTASGLPLGVTLDAQTGDLTGTLAYHIAGTYNVTVSATDGTSTVSQTFVWTVTAVPLALTYPGPQNNAEQDNVSLQLTASGGESTNYTYTASGLPTGLSLDSQGDISGIVNSGASGTYDVTVTASDGISTVTQTFTWNISHQPLALANPGGQANYEGDAVSVPLSASGGANSPYSFSATGLPTGVSIDSQGDIAGSAAYGSAGVYHVTVSASDGSTTVSQSFTWIILSVPLTLANPGPQSNMGQDNVSLQLTAGGGESATDTYTATGLPAGLTLNTQTGLISGTVAATGGGVHTVTVSVSDGISTVTQTFTWTITNVPLALANPGDQNNNEGDTVSVQLTAQGGLSSPYTFSATDLPPGLTLNAQSGLISGTVSYGDATGGPYSVTVTATDGTTTVHQTFTWTIASVPLTFANPGAQSNNEGDAVSLSLSATGGLGTYTYSATNLPPGVTLDSVGGTFTGAIAYGDAQTGVYTVTVSATDGTTTVSQVFTWAVASVPLALANPGNQSNNEGDAVSLFLTPSGGATGTYTFTTNGLPPGIQFDQNAGVFSGTVGYGIGSPNGTAYLVTVTASDGTTTVSQTFTWTITSVPLTLANPGNQHNNEADPVLLVLNASGGESATYTFTAMGLPPGLVIDPNSGVIYQNIDYRTGSPTGTAYNVVVTASDGQSTVSQNFTWTVTSVPLALANPGSQNSNEGAPVSLALAASGGESATYTYSANGLPPGLTFNTETGVIGGRPSFGDAGIYNVTVTASDGVSTVAHQSFTWTVASVPLSLANPGAQSNQTPQSVSLQLSASGGESSTYTYTATQLPPGLSLNTNTGLITGALAYLDDLNHGGVYTVVVTASDGLTTVSQTFTWTVTSVPLALANPGAQTTNEAASVALSLVASGGETGTYTFSETGLPPGVTLNTLTGAITGRPNYGAAGVYNVTVSATDGYTTVSQSFVWTITSVPLALANPGNQANITQDTVALQLSASGGESATYTYSATTPLPDGLTINSATGLISGTLSFAAATTNGGVYAVTVSATDGQTTVSQTFTWTVSELVSNITLTTGGNIAPAGQSVILAATVTSSAPGFGTPTGSVEFFDGTTSLGDGTIDAAGTATLTVTDLTQGDHELTAVYQGDAHFAQAASVPATLTIVASAGNSGSNPPVFTNPGDQTTPQGAPVSLQLSATDSDGDLLTYSAWGLPPGLTLDSYAGTISGTVKRVGIYQTSVLVDDGSNTIVQTFTWTVTANQAPVAANQSFTVNENNSLTITAAQLLAGASDADGDTLTVQIVNGPSNGTLTPNGDGSYTYTPSQNYYGPDGFTFVVVDSNGAPSAVAVANIAVKHVNQPATITVPTGGTVNEGSQYTLQGTISDPDFTQGTLTVTINWGDNTAPTVLSYSAGATAYSATHTYAEDGSPTIQVSLQDGVHPVATATTTLTVNEVPITITFNGNTGSYTVNGADADTLVTDNLSNAPPEGGSYNLIVTAVDDGKVTTASQIVTLPDSGGPDGDGDSDDNPPPPPLELTSVTFSGNGYHTVFADGGAQAPYLPPHWLDENGDGAIDGPSDRSLPVSFVQGTIMQASATFHIDPTSFSGWILVRGIGSGNVFFTPTLGRIVGDQLVTPVMTASSPLPDYVQYIKSFQITWEVLAEGETSWRQVGASVNPVYETFAAPQTTPYEALLAMADGAEQDKTPQDVIDAEWAKLATLKVIPPDGKEPLKYYGSWTTQIITTKDLLADGMKAAKDGGQKGGQCEAWVKYFLDALAAQGLNAPFADFAYKIQPVDAEGFLIKSWDFAEKPSGHPDAKDSFPDFQYVNNWDIGNKLRDKGLAENKYVWVDKPAPDVNFNPKKALPGQGQPVPRADFGQHEVVVNKTTTGYDVYDPSYGKKYTAKDFADFQNQFVTNAVDGFLVTGPFNPNVRVPPSNDFANRFFFKKPAAKDPGTGIKLIPIPKK
jgi:hypothetical protein